MNEAQLINQLKNFRAIKLKPQEKHQRLKGLMAYCQSHPPLIQPAAPVSQPLWSKPWQLLQNLWHGYPLATTLALGSATLMITGGAVLFQLQQPTQPPMAELIPTPTLSPTPTNDPNNPQIKGLATEEQFLTEVDQLAAAVLPTSATNQQASNNDDGANNEQGNSDDQEQNQDDSTDDNDQDQQDQDQDNNDPQPTATPLPTPTPTSSATAADPEDTASTSPTPTPASEPTSTPTNAHVAPVANASLVATLSLPVDNPDGLTTAFSLTKKVDYIIEVRGTWTNKDGNQLVDAQWQSTDNWQTWQDHQVCSTHPHGHSKKHLDVIIDEKDIDWGTYNADHYYQTTLKGKNKPITFRIHDEDFDSHPPHWYDDNQGELEIKIWQLN
ncbi:MAG: hypothetical protein GF390_01890 [Candidatus Pacebacteria bacterium]|nr:hypothetical protein [Candidatus Paceibacterota bacterium]